LYRNCSSLSLHDALPISSPTASTMEVDVTPDDSSTEDDTFAFRQKIVPGGFDRLLVAGNDQDQFLLGDGSAAAISGCEHSYVSRSEEHTSELQSQSNLVC